MTPDTTLTGIIHGKNVELDRETGLPDGQQVSLVIRPVPQKPPAGEGLRSAFGGWADDAEGLDEFLAEMRRSRDAEIDRKIAP
jgi:hypothetical protein